VTLLQARLGTNTCLRIWKKPTLLESKGFESLRFRQYKKHHN